jgi:hypothetical protein
MAFSVTDVQKALKGADYPASREDLVELARANGASNDIVAALEGMDKDSFDGPSGVMEALKGQFD